MKISNIILSALRVSLLGSFLFSCSYNKFEYSPESDGITVTVNGNKKRITFFAPGIVRISATKQDKAFRDSSLAVIAHPDKTNYQVINHKNHITVSTVSLILSINKTTGSITFMHPDSSVYVSELKNKPHIFTDTIINNKSYLKIKQQFTLSDNEGIFGLGQFQNNIMNYRNHDLLLVQANRIAIVPVMVSSNSYGILWDNYSHTAFHDGKDGCSFTSEVADQIDYYFIGSNNIDGVISGYRKLTGKAPMLPKKAYGYWQSKERYRSFGEMINVIKHYRRLKLPVDNIVLDWRYWGDNRHWSSMFFDPKTFPDPAENIQKLHSLNTNLMVSIWPAFGPETDIYKEMSAKGLLYAPQHWSGGKVYDAYNPEARDIYWKYIKKGLMDNGVDALWMDGSEPQITSVASPYDMEKEYLKTEKTYAGPTAKYLNTYALVSSEGVYEHFRKDIKNKRAFILTRSSWAGQQRNSTVTWSGDVASSFDNLKKQICAGINFCMTGVPYWTHDIGGFFPSGNGGMYPKGMNDPAYQELYVRWFQFGAFTPVFRSHGTGLPRELWNFRKSSPSFYEALIKSLKLRYKLMPYIYSLAGKITTDDYTLMRGLVMDFPSDKKTYNIPDEYMFGPAFLVKPVTQSMYFDIQEIPPAIPANSFETPDGKNGLTATYFKTRDLKEKVITTVENNINHNWSGGGLPAGVPEKNFSVRWEGFLKAPESGTFIIAAIADDGVRVWLNEKLIIDKWQDQAATLFPAKVMLSQGKKYHIKVEYYQGLGQSEITLCWIKPSDKKEKITKTKIVKTYLPHAAGWYNYWTNDFFTGGQTTDLEYPIDIFPLFVKAGSIVICAPEKQYADEKTDKPFEVRIYTGNNSEFMFYEDENNNYNYEKGKFNTIKFSWNENKRTLQIGESIGNFNGMKKEKSFKILLITPDSIKTKVCKYTGNAINLNFR
ncbi:MAG: DUF5110 domain-containing protein [Chlorobi bacterium]|nr:DUF5110 domain-containing protein [Chlorobiota bacterium]